MLNSFQHLIFFMRLPRILRVRLQWCLAITDYCSRLEAAPTDLTTRSCNRFRMTNNNPVRPEPVEGLNGLSVTARPSGGNEVLSPPINQLNNIPFRVGHIDERDRAEAFDTFFRYSSQSGAPVLYNRIVKPPELVRAPCFDCDVP